MAPIFLAGWFHPGVSLLSAKWYDHVMTPPIRNKLRSLRSGDIHRRNRVFKNNQENPSPKPHHSDHSGSMNSTGHSHRVFPNTFFLANRQVPDDHIIDEPLES